MNEIQLPDDLNPEVVKATAELIGKLTGTVPPPHNAFPPEWHGHLRTSTSRPHEIARENTALSAPAETMQAVAVPEGWKLVPVKATPEILAEIFRNERDPALAWCNALAAAPQAPVAEAARGDYHPRLNEALDAFAQSHALLDTARAEPVAWECTSPAGQPPSLAFLTSKKPTVEHYEDQGWRVTPLYLAPPAQQAVTLTDAARDVLAERHRQVEQEGWTPEHDDNQRGAMAKGAATYAAHAGAAINAGDVISAEAYRRVHSFQVSAPWPWDAEWWKPTTPRRDLVKACALALAEIERIDRIDRAALQSHSHSEGEAS